VQWVAVWVLTLTIALLGGPWLPTAAAADARTAWDAYRARKYAQAFQELKPLAEAGDAAAVYYVGSLYADGLAVKRDDRAAAEWYRRAAEKGHVEAQFALGFLYLNGAGEGDKAVPANPAAAARWLRPAAESGNASGQYLLGQLYQEGRGVALDEAEALRWSLRAAEQGHAGAQFDVGLIEGKSRDALVRIQAYAWFVLADRQGYPGARENLARLAERLHAREIARATAAADAWRPGGPPRP
jgi:hypothetical protein